MIELEGQGRLWRTFVNNCDGYLMTQEYMKSLSKLNCFEKARRAGAAISGPSILGLSRRNQTPSHFACRDDLGILDSRLNAHSSKHIDYAFG